ncbi:MAG TPA: hypothetical protein VKQ36_09625 [Ktedonobacterales bacterium]|nr:hypothetical protein [Ktedonobacterales bacterium]
MDEGLARQIGAIATVTKNISEADLALFLLVMGDEQIAAQVDAKEPGNTARQMRQIAPDALLAALLTSSAARHALHPQFARFTIADLRFLEPAFTDDTLTATAELTTLDGETLGVTAHCENQEGRRLAEGDFSLRDS